MNYENLKKKLEGCYVTVPTPFKDTEALPLNFEALKEYVEFLLGNGLNKENCTLLFGGAAGDFSAMSFDERQSLAKKGAEIVDGRVPIALGGQTTNTQELVKLVKIAKDYGYDFLQVSCPFYFKHTEEDFIEYIKTASIAAEGGPGIILYNTFWTSTSVSNQLIERLKDLQNIVGLKWATPRTDAMEFEDVTSTYSGRFTIIDNNLFFPYSAMSSLNAKAFEVHMCNFWPEWGAKLIKEVKNKNFEEIARMMVEEAMPFYKLWVEIETNFTSGDGYLDKLCMELVGLPSSRCRPPTRDMRDQYREKTLQYMKKIKVPHLKS
ncbi:MAG: dihydrodipicolinate synthase [Pelagibacteraceae bacterium BACL5 MAG-120820-bin39]|jgi:4-hydroxy-tetrahydrodipicolinate synthase|nr:MAG: dihydrodipicolinate synthase [Pelagibacteraceae bacterium BACL5 MAG-121015-bin10]KRO63390.1 MAG: dihydrodipicolinate synthase [Pelagibacteraceae bacterium BACL5 MAG-120820-bin39]